MNKLTHMIKKSELPQGVTLEQAAADFINSLPPRFFNFDKIEMTEDEAVFEYHKTLAEEIEPLNLDIGLTKPMQSFEEVKTLSTYFNAVDHAEKNNPISNYRQLVNDVLSDFEGDIIAYHGIVTGSDILDHHGKLFEKEDGNEITVSEG